jgi:[acyl-carrier-protein] S-malonyltransferase
MYALLFPGQGSQAVGMLSAHAGHPVVQETFAEARAALGWDVWALCQNGPPEQLNRTEKTQPALLAAGVALWRLWQQQGLPQPAGMAGHSLGEYSALVAAESLDFAAALRLVELRGQLMQAAVPEGQGGMAAVIGLEDAQVQALCRLAPAGEVLEPVNYNAPGQVVVAGSRAALDWLAANGKAQGARMVMPLPVSVPSHCSLMQDAAARLAEALAATEFHTPAIPVYHNLDAQPRQLAADIRVALAAQLHQPVRWTQTIEHFAHGGVTQFVECGPGKVLAGLNKRIAKDSRTLNLETPDAFTAAAEWLAG